MIVFSFRIFVEVILIRDNKRGSWEVSTLVNIFGLCYGFAGFFYVFIALLLVEPL